ncbi:MAG: 2-hydroxyacid dehydrogenase [Hyphomicrobiaceae bacterium]
MKAAFAGSFSRELVRPTKNRLRIPCEIVEEDETDIIPLLVDADVLVSMSFTREMADAAPKLKLLQVPGAGIDRVDRSAVRPGTSVSNVYGHETGIAEYVIGSMIALSRSFLHLDKELRLGKWDSQWAVDSPAPPLMPELSGKTVAILGYGHIGEAVARRASAFGMKVTAIRRTVSGPPPEPLVRLEKIEMIDSILSEADFVVVTLPLTADTKGLLNAARLSRMKPEAYLINVARAAIADEQALFEALSRKLIAGAALDVWYRYPKDANPTLPSTFPFHELSNVLLSPHASGWTDGMLSARADLIAQNIERTARGDLPQNLVAA